MSKILITGGAGFIGYHLALEWAKQGAQVDILDNFLRGKRDQDLERLLEDPNINLVADDLMTISDFATDYEIIYHLAAIIGVKNVLKCPYNVLKNNVEMTIRIIELAKQQDQLKRFLFASTSEVYAGTLQYFTMPVPTPESTPLAVTDLQQPRTSYMLSKMYGEALCIQSGLPYTIFRPHNVYGPRMGMAHVIPELLKKVHQTPQKGKLEVYSPTHTRTFCYIDDAVSMLRQMAQETDCIRQTLNLGQEAPEVTIEELSHIILEVVGKPLEIQWMEDDQGSPKRRCPNTDKTRAFLKDIMNTPLAEGIQKTYNWYKDNF